MLGRFHGRPLFYYIVDCQVDRLQSAGWRKLKTSQFCSVFQFIQQNYSKRWIFTGSTKLMFTSFSILTENWSTKKYFSIKPSLANWSYLLYARTKGLKLPIPRYGLYPELRPVLTMLTKCFLGCVNE